MRRGIELFSLFYKYKERFDVASSKSRMIWVLPPGHIYIMLTGLKNRTKNGRNSISLPSFAMALANRNEHSMLL